MEPLSFYQEDQEELWGFSGELSPLPPLSLHDASLTEYLSPAGSDLSEQLSDDCIAKTSTFPAPLEFCITTMYSKSATSSSDFDVNAAFDSSTGELISFTNAFAVMSEVPIEVLQSGFTWGDLHRKEFQFPAHINEQIEKSIKRIRTIHAYLQSPGPKLVTFREFLAFATPRGTSKFVTRHVYITRTHYPFLQATSSVSSCT